MLFRKPGQWKTLAKEAVERTGLVAKFFCLCHVTNTYLFSSVLVYGPSMYPTLNHTGDVVLVERLSTRFGKVEQGDIVVVRSPENPNKTVTKRVLGLEGDRVTFMPDPHLSEDTATIVVPKGQVWIQGDNVYASRDSRHFGPVPYGLLEGKVFYRVLKDQYSCSCISRCGQSQVLELWSMGCGSENILKICTSLSVA